MCLLFGLHLIFQVLVLSLEILDVGGVAGVLPPHKGDVLARLLQYLGPGWLVALWIMIIE